MIFQDPYASLNPRWTVGGIVAEPIRAHEPIEGRSAILERTGELLTHVALAAADRVGVMNAGHVVGKSEAPLLARAPAGGEVACHAVAEGRI